MGSSTQSSRTRVLITGAIVTIAAILLTLGFWFGVAHPKFQAFQLTQIETRAEHYASMLKDQVSDHSLHLGKLSDQEIININATRDKLGLIKFKLFSDIGRVIYSTDSEDIGSINQRPYFLEHVSKGLLYSKISRKQQRTLEDEYFDRDLVETYVPMIHDGEFHGAFEIYLDATNEIAAVESLFNQMHLTQLAIVASLVILSFLVVWHSYRIVVKQEQSQNLLLREEIKQREQFETKLRTSERHYDHLAHHDTLTGLPNRRALTGLVDVAIARAKRQEKRFAFLFLDLDRFKNINDTLGHVIGDLVLKEASHRFTQALRTEDFICRMGGDEFAILLEDVRDHEAGVAHVCERLLDSLNSPIDIEKYRLNTGVSIGIAFYPEDGNNLDELLMHSDNAMYGAKARAGGCYYFYTSSLNEQAERRLIIEADLNRAIEEEQFFICLQPLVDIASGQVNTAETLLRWRHPSLGLVPPLDFIPYAEESGLIVRLGEWVLSESCRLAQQVSQQGFDEFSVAVNLSGRQFKDHNLCSKVEQILVDTGLPPQRLGLELTESVVMSNAEENIQTLQQFADMGIGISIDDFGTGYSSLSYLSKFPIHSLKIDRSFIDDIDSVEGAAIVSSVISLARSLQLTVVAEGIETESQLSFLREHACDYAQGYLFARPLELDEFINFLEEYNTTPEPVPKMA